jgi:hypothetical protein
MEEKLVMQFIPDNDFFQNFSGEIEKPQVEWK